MPLDDRSAASSRDSSKPKSVSFGSRIVNLTIDIPSSRRSQPNSIPTSKPRWKTSEFFFYYVFIGIVVLIAVWIPIQLSSRMSFFWFQHCHLLLTTPATHHNYPYYSSRLQPGWLFGRALVSVIRWFSVTEPIQNSISKDNSDGQYRSFRNNIPTLALLSIAYFTLKYIYNFTVSRTILSPPSNRIHLIPFIAVFSILLILGLHGTSAFKVILIISMNYWISKFSRGISYGYLMIWTFNVAVLFANETYAGYRYASLHSSLEFLVHPQLFHVPEVLTIQQDNIKGVYPRWHVNFNITMLRLVAFGMDYRWASDKPPSLDVSSQRCHFFCDLCTRRFNWRICPRKTEALPLTHWTCILT
jgi:protein-cysteine N-palmitoyltransferase HHAT